MKYLSKLNTLLASGILTTVLSITPVLSTKRILESDNTNVRQTKAIVTTAPQEVARPQPFPLLELGDALLHVISHLSTPDLISTALSCKLLKSHSYNAPM